MTARYFSSAPLGVVMTAGILWLMQALIASGPALITDPPPRFVLDWVHVPAREEVVRKEPVPERIPPPLPEPSREPASDGDDVGVVAVPTIPPPAPSGFDTFDFGQSTSPLVAVMNVRPTYPPEAARRGLEGFVTVRFDVTELGTVANVVVLESSHRVFERSAVEAALRTRYRPRVVDGVARATTGLHKRYSFRMEN